jgi:L-lactate dehydrogenase complex protein LldG
VSTDIATRVREALEAATRRGVFPGALPARPVPYLPEPPVSGLDGMIALFRQHLEALGGTFHRVLRAEGIPACLLDLVARVPGDDRWFTAWQADQCAETAAAALLAHGWHRVGAAAAGTPHLAAVPVDLARCTLGITGADAALAATGSLVLHTGPGRGRLTSLLPPVHVAFLSAERIVWDLAHWLHANSDVDRSSNVVIVTGPSRTADIEMTLTRGVHGPREVHVVLVGSGS